MRKPASGVLRWTLAVVLCAACEGASKRPPSEVLGGGDGGPKPSRDAGPPLDCQTALSNQDADYDTFSRDTGDCNDCDPLISPAAFEVPGNTVDEDCDGMVLTERPVCDAELEPESNDPEDAARALGLCSFTGQIARTWGVRRADWRLLDDADELEDPRQVWLSDHFGGVLPRDGKRLLVLSTGVARDVDDPDYTPKCDVFSSEDQGEAGYSGGVPPPKGYPVDSSLCTAKASSSKDAPAFNDVGLEIYLRIPSNARSLSFDSIFFTSEYPSWVCTPFNDFFVVSMDDEENVVFDAHGDPIGVNTALLSVCRETTLAARKIACEQGPALLAHTGFDKDESSCGVTTENAQVGGASTGWLHTSVPVDPTRGYLTLRFLLWDSADPNLDSTVAIDNLQFETLTLEEPSTRPISAAP
ncbi:MAG: choice-of-anchor L domain-containing protein [Myxococcales bacterium]